MAVCLLDGCPNKIINDIHWPTALRLSSTRIDVHDAKPVFVLGACCLVKLGQASCRYRYHILEHEVAIGEALRRRYVDKVDVSVFRERS